jgi:hypothetical protein
MEALDRTLRADGTTIPEELAGFGVANRRPGSFYSEGTHYRRSGLAKSWTFHTGHGKTGWQDTTPWHLSNRTFAFTPGKGYGSRQWRIRFDLDLPSRGHSPYAVATIYGRHGAPRTEVIRLSRSGGGKLKTGFSSRTVKRVELTLTNGGHHYKCNRGYAYSCDGLPEDAFRHYKFRAVTLRAR